MRKLDRNPVPAPPCLGRYQHGRDNWDKVPPADKSAIRKQLEQMQGRRCAYCDGPLDRLGEHIEHLWPKGRFPQRTFDWHNLYLSCDQQDSCGQYKDNGAENYHPNDILDPCKDDPDRYFRFRPDGTIDVSPNGTTEKARAEKTLRVFNLDPGHGRLRTMRRQAADAYLARDPNILDALMGFDETERRAVIAAELAEVAHEPFGAVIRHLFLTLL